MLSQSHRLQPLREVVVSKPFTGVGAGMAVREDSWMEIPIRWPLVWVVARRGESLLTDIDWMSAETIMVLVICVRFKESMRVRRMRAKTEAWDTSSPLHSGAQAGWEGAEPQKELQKCRAAEEKRAADACLSVFRVVRAARGAPLWNPARQGAWPGTQRGPWKSTFIPVMWGGRIQVAETKVRVKYGGSRKV